MHISCETLIQHKMEAKKHHKFFFLIITYLSDQTGLVTLEIIPAYYILLSNPSQNLLGQLT